MSDVIQRLNAALEGRYQIQEELGEGGMATVYLARDLKHNRQVALKVLRPELAAVVGAERFLTEIETTANLQHPNILPLFDSGEADSFLFYVMPYVEGESLRERIQKEHQLPVEEALEIAEDVASALQYAHDQGVVHRDVKPANILLSRGKPLVADFGIALALSEAGGGRITETGLSLGTPHYMSPEQAAGERSLDKRSDVYAVGCVLYEMLTGQPPYGGPTAQAVLGRILTGDPTRPSEHRKAIPANVEHAILKALEKLPADRFESAAEFIRALENPSFRHGVGQAADGGVLTPASGTRGWALITIVAVVAFLAGALGWSAFTEGDPEGTMRHRIYLTDLGGAPAYWIQNMTALEPGGPGIVFADTAGAGDLVWQLWWKPGDRTHPVPVPNSGEALGPTFSPDGQWLAFMVDNELRKQPILGGTSVLLSDTAGGGTLRGLAWLDDGTIIFEDHEFAIRRIDEDGGPSEVLYTRPEIGAALSISGLVGGGGFLFVGCPGATCPPGLAALYVADLERDTIQKLLDGAVHAWHLPGDRIVYADARGAVFTASLDLEELALGAPTPLFDGVQATDGSAEIQLDRDGSILYRTGSSSQAGFRPVWVDRDGRAEPVDPDWSPGSMATLALSPAGDRLAIAITPVEESGPERIWIKELPNGPLTPLTGGPTRERRPAWVRGGRAVAYIGYDTTSTPPHARVMPADGSAPAPDTLLALEQPIYEVLETAGDPFLFRVGNAGPGEADVGYADPKGDEGLTWLLDSPFNEMAMALSPDGRWLAYVSDLSGQREVFVRPFPGGGSRVQVSRNGGSEPLWAHSGRELFYRDGEGWMSVASVDGDGEFRVTARERLFDAQGYRFLANYRAYDVAPDDQRFLMLEFTAGGDDSSHLILVENWFTELERTLEGR